MGHILIYRSSENPNSHMTAKERHGPSYPTRRLFRGKLLTGRVLDFGCGVGADLDFLRVQGLDVSGFDPYYAPAEPSGRYDTILCIYVLNVLLPEEQSHVLMAVSELLSPGGRAYFAVRRDVRRGGFRTHAKYGCQVYQCNVVLPYRSVFRNEYCEIYEYHHINELSNPGAAGCPFCAPSPDWELVTESAQAYAVLDPAAGDLGQCLIIPKRHEPDYFNLPARVKTACWLMAERVKMLLAERCAPTGYRLTIDVGETVDHAHMRLAAETK